MRREGSKLRSFQLLQCVLGRN
uniref:Uncharacterized protein n=1 Tax=Arundo donax TaxID=35708 RepID=A0A0A9BHN8_ARUDO